MKTIPYLLCAALLTGCAGDDASEAEPAAAALSMMRLGIDADAAENNPIRQLIATCGGDPEIEEIDACGQTVAGDASYAWEDCTVSLPDGARAEEAISSGEVSMTAELDGDCDAGDAVLTRTVDISAEQRIGEEMSVAVSGAATISLSQDGIAAVSLDLAREMSRDEDTSASASLSGDIVVEDGSASGTVEVSMDHPWRGSRSVSLTLDGISRDEACEWPVDGSVTWSSDDEAHTLLLGPDCGEATLDGEAIDLGELGERRGRR